jgi:alkylation response protein AidB-like acyl-CoA dehydrogenase
VGELTATWRDQRADRQARRALDPADFAALRDAGLLRSMVPTADGGLWDGVAASTRPISAALRTLATADPSVALVSAMHPAVLGFWMANPDPAQPRWEAQRREVAATAAEGRQWGTVTSEPGSGGDIARTRTVAVPIGDDGYLLTGDKHFGSGFGVADFMFTTAKADGEDPAAFYLDVRGVTGDADPMRITAPWDGAGMAATQSHGFRLESMPATRLAWDRPLPEMQLGAGGFTMALFTAVVLGVVDAAMAEATRVLAPRRDTMRAYEQTEWARADADHWLAQAAFDRLVTTVEQGDPARSMHAGLRAKVSIAELAEQILTRIGRVVGGGAYSRRSPFAAWHEDVRALGFLRPPWALAHDQVFATSWPA